MLNVLWVKLKGYKEALPMIMVMTVMALVLIYIFGRGFDGGYVAQVAIVDEDRTDTSRSYIEQVMASDGFEFTKVTFEQGKRDLENGAYIALVEISQGFEGGILSGESQVTMYKSGDSIEHQTLRANLQNISRLYRMNEGFVTGISTAFNSMSIPVDEEVLHNKIVENREKYPVLSVTMRTLDDELVKGYDAIKHSFMGYILFFSMFTMVFGIGSIVEEREDKVWQRQIVAPVSNSGVMVGNLLASFIVGMVQLSIMMIVSRYIFGIDFGGSLLAILIVLSGYVIAITCLGLLMSNLVKTSQQLGSFSPVVIVGTSMIGGCMWPLSIIKSKALLFLADLTPQRWAYLGLKNIIVNNGGLGDVVIPLIYLLLIALILFVLAMIPEKLAIND